MGALQYCRNNRAKFGYQRSAHCLVEASLNVKKTRSPTLSFTVRAGPESWRAWPAPRLQVALGCSRNLHDVVGWRRAAVPTW
jgi:hypothetical protein